MKLFVDFILVGGIVITVLILFLLFRSTKRLLPQKLLILFFATLLFYLLNGYADIHEIPLLYVVTFLFSDTIEIFLGPLILLYIKSLFEDNKKLVKKNWYHFVLPFLYIIAVSIPFLVSIMIEEYVFDYLRVLNENSEIAVLILMLWLVGYIIWSLRLFHKYKKAMLSNFSTIELNDFNWVKQMLIGTLIVSIVDIVFSLYEILFSELNWDSQYVTGVSVIILIAYLGYYGINQTSVLLPGFLIKQEPEGNGTREKPNHLSGYAEEEVRQLQSELEKILLMEKPYLDEDLTLGKLAAMLPTTDKKLSTLLNQIMGTNFYDYINKYRVAAVKEKLNSKEFENLTLLGIAYESGFKSKTSFNRIFKKETGLSPSEYKKKL